ncbi:MAG: histidine kinase, partial [Treponema sp.]|nr:histidine kinase [Treponema sp.]
MARFADKVESILNKIKIKESLSYLFVFVFFIPFVIISSFFILMLYTTMHDWELKRAQSNLEITEEKFTDILSNITLISDRIYINKRIQGILKTDFKDVGQVYDAYSNINYLEDYLHTYKEVDSFRIYTENSTLLENQFIQKVTPIIFNSEWYNNAKEMKGTSYWTYKEDSIKKKKFLCMIRAIYNATSDEFLGVLVINVNPYAIQDTLRDKTISTFIVFDYTIIYSSSVTAFSLYEQPLIKYIYQHDYSISKMTNMIIGDERVGVVAVDFYPINSVSLKFEIINVIPIKQLVSSTLRVIYLTLIILAFIIILLILVLAIYSGYIDIRVYKIDQQIEHVFENNFEIAKSIGGNDEFEQIYQTIQNMSENTNYLISQLRRQTEENTSLALQQSEISFKMLSNQINPHFLFNTLETIRMKAISSSDKEVANMLKLLASLLRYNLSVRGQPVPLYNELEAVQNYLAIQHMRFGNR